MVNSVNFNPMITTNASGSFNLSSYGMVQGMAMDDPSARNWLAGGVLSTAETLPMWGGVAICEHVPSGVSPLPVKSLGGVITRATTITTVGGANNLTGFSVFDQAHNMINTPTSQVPIALSNMSVNFYRMGTNARIAVKCDPSLAASFASGVINPQVSWDFNDSLLQPYVASGATVAITSITWANGVGTVVAGAAVPQGLGDTIYISGATNTGTGGVGAVNGPFVIGTYTDTTHFTLLMPAAAGVIGTIGGTILSNQGTGALNVRILEVDANNCMTVTYDAASGSAMWDRNGCCALILI